jgi:ABC-2 type transport system ATP-binding protein
MNVIQVVNLTRTFNSLHAVDGISFSVEEGEVFGFLGPNGAGKTTTIRMLTGQLQPTSGWARVAGCDVVKEQERLKPLIGVVFEYQNLYERMSARENLEFNARLYGVGQHRVNELLERVDLMERANDRIQHYSNGMRQRLLIARALLHNPRVLFLDEPTRGLDPGVALEIRRLVVQLAQAGVTIFLTTHYMDEADQLCQRVAFINQGRIAALDTPEQLKLTHGQRNVTVILEGGEQITLSLEDQDAGASMAKLMATRQILTLHTGEATLEEVFLQLTGRRLLE